MNRAGQVFYNDILAGTVFEDEDGYGFVYEPDYVLLPKALPVSLTLPLQVEPFCSVVLFAFFDGLIPEGWLLDIAVLNWKINQRDRMGLLLTLCQDCIGAVSVKNIIINNEK